MTTYNVYRDEVLIASGLTTNAFHETGLTNDQAYAYRIAAVVDGVEQTSSNTVTLTPTAGAPVDTPDPVTTSSDFTDLPPYWTLVFADEFDYEVARGHMLDGSYSSYRGAPITADGRYQVYNDGYPTAWHDTSGHGWYEPELIEITGGILDIHIQTIGGVHRVAAFRPIPTGATAAGGLLGARFHVRLRADSMPGYKGVPMLWLDAATTDSGKYVHGEIDGPESDFDHQPKAFMHKTNTTAALNEQTYFTTPAGTTWQDWHDWVTEWIPGISVEYFMDGVSYGKTYDRIPTTAAHVNMQFETSLSGIIPSNATEGHVQISRLGVWAYNP